MAITTTAAKLTNENSGTSVLPPLPVPPVGSSVSSIIPSQSLSMPSITSGDGSQIGSSSLQLVVSVEG